MIRRFFEKIKQRVTRRKELEQPAKDVEKVLPKAQEPAASLSYANRFLKFYYLNKERLSTERRSSYAERKSKGICVRCSRPVVGDIVFCAYHQEKQKVYNRSARVK